MTSNEQLPTSSMSNPVQTTTLELLKELIDMAPHAADCNIVLKAIKAVGVYDTAGLPVYEKLGCNCWKRKLKAHLPLAEAEARVVESADKLINDKPKPAKYKSHRFYGVNIFLLEQALLKLKETKEDE